MADIAAACESCGWAVAFCFMLAFGTFGVPIKSNAAVSVDIDPLVKSDAAVSVDIDPLVFQTYKTFMCFVTSRLVLLAGEGFSFTPWGIVSGMFSVPGGVATIYAIKNAGLAIGIGIGWYLLYRASRNRCFDCHIFHDVGFVGNESLFEPGICLCRRAASRIGRNHFVRRRCRRS
jgi:hypothetical protein